MFEVRPRFVIDTRVKPATSLWCMYYWLRISVIYCASVLKYDFERHYVKWKFLIQQKSWLVFIWRQSFCSGFKISLKVREKPQKLKESYWLMAQVGLNFNGGVTVLAGDVEVKEKNRCWFNGFAKFLSEQISVTTLGCLIQERGSK